MCLPVDARGRVSPGFPVEGLGLAYPEPPARLHRRLLGGRGPRPDGDSVPVGAGDRGRFGRRAVPSARGAARPGLAGGGRVRRGVVQRPRVGRGRGRDGGPGCARQFPRTARRVPAISVRRVGRGQRFPGCLAGRGGPQLARKSAVAPRPHLQGPAPQDSGGTRNCLWRSRT